MKNQILIRLPRFIRKLESALCQLCAVFTSYLISYNLSCAQVDYNTNIIIFLVIPKAGNIADPHLIWARRIELLIQIILVLTFLFVVIILRTLTDTDKPHILHKLPDHSLGYLYSPRS